MPHPKLLGERAESAFLTAALDRGFAVSKPWGDSLAYDFILDTSPLVRPGRLLRIQVRGVYRMSECSYRVDARHHRDHRPITSKDADVLAVLVVPRACWYLIPISAFTAKCALSLFPCRSRTRDRWGRYREAWHLLKN